VSAQRQPVDVEAVRARHPLAEVVAASGVELHQRGHGWVGCCPFHEDATPSLSVDGVPDRFHCFGCGASGDVIDFVQRSRGAGFLEAVEALEGDPRAVGASGIPPMRPHLRVVQDAADPMVTAARAFEINALAWEHLSSPVPQSSAVTYLRHHRGIDLCALLHEHPENRLVGYAGNGWTTLTDHLRAAGVTDDELVVMDLATRTRGGRLIDTLRNRVIVPVADEHGRIQGFVGRDVTGHPAAPKYRNPTRTPVFDKAQVIYRPTHEPLAPTAHAVVVEGVLDALALSAAAAAEGISNQIAPCSANGISVSAAQARQVLRVSPNPVRIALDGDDAGCRGTARWLTAASLDAHHPALVVTMPDGLDPAAWLARHGPSAIHDFLAPVSNDPATDRPAAMLPGRQLAQLARDRARDPVRDTVAAIAPVARRLGPQLRARLIDQATAEMTRHGWNAKDMFAIALQRELYTNRPAAAQLRENIVAPSLS
jgi:DNA primase